MIDYPKVIRKFDRILARGLCPGVGDRDGQMCIEAAICAALGLPHGDQPECVAAAVRSYKIALNDSEWSSPEARAAGLRDLGIAQIGSLGVVDDTVFVKRMAEKTISFLIPALFRETLGDDAACMAAADECEREGTADSAASATDAADAAWAARTADAAWAARTAAAAWAADAARTAAVYGADAAVSANSADKYLLMSAALALETLRELKSPGCAWLEVAE